MCWDVLCCAVLCCIVLCCVVLCCVVLSCTLLCCAVLSCVVLCCAVLCCAVLCCFVLCCSVLCCFVLFCVVLCCASSSVATKFWIKISDLLKSACFIVLLVLLKSCVVKAVPVPGTPICGYPLSLLVVLRQMSIFSLYVDKKLPCFLNVFIVL